jgi:hypothetical protein
VISFDESVASISMKIANRSTRRGFLGRAAAGFGVLVGGPAGALALAPAAKATHTSESILCDYHPDIYINGCASSTLTLCIGGSWLVCDGRCANKAREWFDCCDQCTAGCHTHTDPTDPNGVGWSCCYTGYCGSGCSGQKVVCRFWRCNNLLCG